MYILIYMFIFLSVYEYIHISFATTKYKAKWSRSSALTELFRLS